jgi:hypothetical protein
MKLTPQTSSLVSQLNHCSNQTNQLNQAQTQLSRLQQQDPDNLPLYRLLAQQNRTLRARLFALQPSGPASPSPSPWTCLRDELQSLQQLAQSHCQLVAWLYHGNPDSDGPANSLPAPKAPQPKPQRPAASNASPAPASVDFN